MGKHKKKKLTKLALLKCEKDMIISGRNADGSPDTCFHKDTSYLFVVDEKKEEMFIVNETGEVHFMDAPDSNDELVSEFEAEYFNVVKVGKPSEFDLDEFTLMKLEKLYKERYEYSED